MRNRIFAFLFLQYILAGLASAQSSSILFNEICPSNIDQWVDPSFNYGGWVELYNPTSTDIDITEWYLSDNLEKLQKVKISQTTSVPANGFCTLWFDHYNLWSTKTIDMKLDCDGASLYLSDSSGELVAAIDYPIAVSRCSWARTENGGETWNYCANPTPGLSNNSSKFASERLAAPEVDIESQIFSSGTKTLNVTIPEGCTLRYTTNGSAPTETNGSTSTTGRFTTTATCRYRFRLFKDGYLPSPVVNRTLIKSSLAIEIPILSISGTKDNFYGDSLGFFVKGVNGRGGNGSSEKCNWNMDWERPTVFEYFTANGQLLFAQETGLERFGGHSRSKTPYSFKIKANKRYEGVNTLLYPFFEEKPYLKHKALLARNGGNDNKCRVYDVALQRIVATSGIDVDYQAYQPIAHFVNGVWKGTINLREPSNKHYVYANYGLDEDQIDQFEMNPDSGYCQKCGTYDAMKQLYDLSKSASDESTYDQICNLLDMDEFCNYMAVEFYLRNWDWPQNNLKAWRPRQEDGRFRFILHDLDGFEWSESPFEDFAAKQIYTFDPLYDDTVSQYTKEIEVVTIFLNLLNNDTFRKKFIDTFSIVAYSVFEPNRCVEVINSITRVVAPTQALYNSESPWLYANHLIWNLPASRQPKLMQQLKEFEPMQLTDKTTQSVTVRSNIDEACVSVNDMTVPTGYFNGVFYPPVTILAEAPAGYNFVGWRQTTPIEIFPVSQTWKYYDQGSMDGTGWYAEDYDDSAWSSGAAPLGYDTANKLTYTTTLSYGSNDSSKNPTYYFRTEFTLDQEPSSYEAFQLSFAVDDGMVLYVNGQEVKRHNMPSGTVSYSTYTPSYAPWNPDTGTVDIKPSYFHSGKNVIAIEVHNESASSPDIFMSASLTRLVTSDETLVSIDPEYTPAASDSCNLIACFEPIPTDSISLPPVVINEVSATNDTYINDLQKKKDWIELYNTTSEDIDLSGMYLTDKLSKPQKYQIGSELAAGSTISTIIPAYGYKIIWCDKESGVTDLHASFKLGNDDDSHIMLTAADGSWSDTLTYNIHGLTETVGRYPDASRKVYLMTRPTIAKSNQLTSYSTICPQFFADSIAPESTYAHYSLEVLPFAYKADTEVALTLKNASEITSISFDVSMPTAFSKGYGITPLLSTSKFLTSSALNADSTIHVSINSKSRNRIGISKAYNIAKMALSFNQEIPEDVYTITLKNILLTDASGKTYKAKDYTTEIFAGNAPTITAVNGQAAFHGNYGGATEYALLSASLPQGATIDLTEVTNFAEDPTELISDNVIYTNETLSYGRAMSTQWGTTCLPFPLESQDSLQFYALTYVSDEAMTFEKVSSVDAFTPVLFKAGGSKMLVKQTNDNTIPVDFATSNTQSLEKIQSVGGWIMNGSFINETLNVSDINAYALIGDKFCKVNKTLFVKAFHAWFQNNGSAVSAKLRIEEGNGADELQLIEQEDGSVKLYYDVQGRRQPSKQSNQISISPDKKSFNR